MQLVAAGNLGPKTADVLCRIYCFCLPSRLEKQSYDPLWWHGY